MNKLIIAIMLAGCATAPTSEPQYEAHENAYYNRFAPIVSKTLLGAGGISLSAPTSGVAISGTTGTFSGVVTAASFTATVGGLAVPAGTAGVLVTGTNTGYRITSGSGTSEFLTAGTVMLSCNGGTGICTDSFGFATSTNFTVTSTGNVVINNNAGSSNTATGITPGTGGLVRHWSEKTTVINTALAAASTTDVTLWTTGANTRLIRVTADVTQVFTGGALSAMTVQCGNVAGGNQYLLAGSVFTAQTTLGDVAAEIGAGLLDATRADMGTPAAGIPGAIAISCRFTCTGANCSAATQGSVTFEIEGVTYP